MLMREERIINLERRAAAESAKRHRFLLQRQPNHVYLIGGFGEAWPAIGRHLSLVDHVGLIAFLGWGIWPHGIMESKSTTTQDNDGLVINDRTRAANKRSIAALEIMQVPLKPSLPWNPSNLCVRMRHNTIIRDPKFSLRPSDPVGLSPE